VSNRKWELSPIKLYTYNLKDRSKKLSFIKYMDKVFDNCENLDEFQIFDDVNEEL